MNSSTARRGGFSLIELVIVVVIIGIIAAIAIPRLSRGAAGASDSALAGDLKVLRTALDMYATEHGGVYPANDKVVDALTKYSDDQGGVTDAKDATHIYGPYIRTIPALPVGSKKGKSGIAAATGDDIGWLYNSTGSSYTLTPNTTSTEADDKGKLYSAY